MVIGADSQTSDYTAGVRWSSQKLEQISNRPLVVGFSGHVSPLRKIRAVLDEGFARSRSATFQKRDRVPNLIQKMLRPIYEDLSQKHPDAKPGSVWKITVAGLTVYWAENAPQILEVEDNGEVNFHDHFRAIGSGARSAYAAWTALGREQLSEYPEGMALKILWRILDVCIETELAGVGWPVEIWAITEKGARHILGAELDSLEEISNRDFLFSLTSPH